MKSDFPPAETLIELEPEEVGPYLIVYLNKRFIENNRNKFHRYNETSPENSDVRNYAGELRDRVSEVLGEAWMWLVTEGFLSPSYEDNSNDWVRISRRGQKIKETDDYKSFQHINLLPKKVLDPVLSAKVWSPFIRGDFETAIFVSFKEVEVRLRKVTGLSVTDLGTKLARKAFDPKDGKLTNYVTEDLGERQAFSDLFAGALGAFKNPTSHRDIDFTNPSSVVGLILFANTLLAIIDERKKDAR